MISARWGKCHQGTGQGQMIRKIPKLSNIINIALNKPKHEPYLEYGGIIPPCLEACSYKNLKRARTCSQIFIYYIMYIVISIVDV